MGGELFKCMKELYKEFPEISKPQWLEKLKSDLKLEDPSSVVDQVLNEGLTHPAYCHFSDIQGLEAQSQYQHTTANHGESWQGARHWWNLQRCQSGDEKMLNSMILESLQGGCEAVELESESSDWSSILEKVSYPHCQIGLEAPLSQAVDFMEFLSRQEDYQGYLVIEDLVNLDQSALIKLLAINQRPGHFRALSLRESDQSLPGTALLLSQLLVLLEKLKEGISFDALIGNIQIQVGLGDHYLWEICRLRALRMLFHQLLLIHGIEDHQPGDTWIKAHTTLAGSEDGNQQMLSNTYQAMSAILGGCNLLCVTPHGEGETEHRIARNVGLILREESNLHRVADPVAGSYYLESLTDRMARKIWGYLQEIERSGGYLKMKSTTHE